MAKKAKPASEDQPSPRGKKTRESNDQSPPQKKAAGEVALTAKQTAFLAAYAQCGVVSDAARAAGINRTTHYQWLEQSAEYAAAFAQSQQRLADLLVDEAVRRALAGSDRLLEFLLKGLKPEMFNRQQVEVQAPGGLAMVAVWQMSDDELEEEISRYQRIIK